MKIIVDAFGGDNAPLEIIKGARQAIDELSVLVVLTGNEEIIKKVAEENGISLDGIEIVDAPEVVDICEDPKVVLRAKRNSSLGKGFDLLAEGKGDAFVSAGSTAAVVVGATLIVKRLKGVKRAALATVMPGDKKSYMLMDIGANAVCRPEMLLQFGIMGEVYMNKVMGVEKPETALVNIGAEETKGTELQLEAYKLMKEGGLNFIGNIEPRYIPEGNADVVVCDGFTGNVILKLTEGVAKTFSANLKRIFKKNIITILAAALVSGGIKDFKKKMDYTEHGGAPLLGLTKPVIKAHGSSNAKAIKNAIRQAKIMVESNTISLIKDSLESALSSCDSEE